ncbi:hypothetical protein SRHO_G00155790 [Serrasalmus rhombeus]
MYTAPGQSANDPSLVRSGQCRAAVVLGSRWTALVTEEPAQPVEQEIGADTREQQVQGPETEQRKMENEAAVPNPRRPRREMLTRMARVMT